MNSQQSIHKLFERQVEERPESIAVIYNNQSITYADLNSRANQLAHYLRAVGVNADRSVALCLERSIDTLIAMLGILKAGGAYLPLDPSQPEERLSMILQDSKTAFLVSQFDIAKKFIHYHGTKIILDKLPSLADQPDHNPDFEYNSANLAYIIYTSGSTGKPKGVLIEHGSVVNYCRWLDDYCDYSDQDHIDFSANYVFDMAVTTSIVPLMLGLKIIICPDDIKKTPRAYLNHLKNHQINTIKITPSYFHILLQEVSDSVIPLPHLKNIILGGENLPTKDCQSWLSLYQEHRLFNEYGPTEATVAVSQFKVTYSNVFSLGAYVPIGKPGPTMECYLLDDAMKPISDGDTGELYIGGNCLARGYLNAPALTNKQFVRVSIGKSAKKRLYKTGDLCRRLADESIEYIGRIDDQIKIRGYRVEPEEIEKYLSAHPAIKEALVLARGDKLNEKRLIAYYILNDGHSLENDNEIRQYLQQHLPEFMIPSAFVCVDSFPLNENGKLDRAALPIPRYTASHHYQAPSTALEITLSEIWSEELGVKPVGIMDDFFELGGHSLSAARVVSKINKLLKKDIAVNLFYEAPTIKKMAVIISNMKNNNTDDTHNIMIKESEPLPLGDFQFMLWISNTFEPKAKKLNIIIRHRVQGRFNIDALNLAFDALLQKHMVLLHRVFKFRPAQILQKKDPFKTIEKNLENLSDSDVELLLKSSVDELLSYYPWPKNSPLLMAKLFYLKNNVSELQIVMPHIISDDVSSTILLNDLSSYYQQQLSVNAIKMDTTYRDYLLHEKRYSQLHTDRDITFWEKYLNKTEFMYFPSSSIVQNAFHKNFHYTNYFELPDQGLKNLQQFCAKKRISMYEGLSAALGLALYKFSDQKHESDTIAMNIVKSTRDDPIYDDTIGCFLRTDLVKVIFSKKSTLENLAQQIHHSFIDTSLYQRCSSLIKFACVKTLRKEKHLIKHSLIRVFTYIYTTIFPTPALNRKMLNLCGRLASFERQNYFFININVQNHFLSDTTEKKVTNYFGFKEKSIDPYHYDLLKIDNFLDICFLREGCDNTPYLVMSANLKPVFLERIAKEVVRILESETLGNQAKKVLEHSEIN